MKRLIVVTIALMLYVVPVAAQPAVPTNLEAVGDMRPGVRPTYRWSPSSGAVNYSIFINTTIYIYGQTFTAASACGSGLQVCQVTPDVPLNAGSIVWSVQATNGSGQSSSLASSSFVVAVPTAAPAIIITRTPLPTATNTPGPSPTPTFTPTATLTPTRTPDPFRVVSTVTANGMSQTVAFDYQIDAGQVMTVMLLFIGVSLLAFDLFIRVRGGGKR